MRAYSYRLLLSAELSEHHWMPQEQHETVMEHSAGKLKSRTFVLIIVTGNR